MQLLLAVTSMSATAVAKHVEYAAAASAIVYRDTTTCSLLLQDYSAVGDAPTGDVATDVAVDDVAVAVESPLKCTDLRGCAAAATCCFNIQHSARTLHYSVTIRNTKGLRVCQSSSVHGTVLVHVV
jgi:hypothetical protein